MNANTTEARLMAWGYIWGYISEVEIYVVVFDWLTFRYESHSL